MKQKFVVGLFLFTIITSCIDEANNALPGNAKSLKNNPNFSSELNKQDSLNKENQDNEKILFDIDLGVMKLSALADHLGKVTILGYPAEWFGSVSLIRFEGSPQEGAFSESKCQSIRKIASHPMSKSIVRGGYRSLLAFGIPVFLSSQFFAKMQKAAKVAGVPLALEVVNSVYSFRASANLVFKDGAISNILGDTESFSHDLNVGKFGMEIGDNEKQLFIYSGDILCDLIFGNAELVISYPINNENDVIKVKYGPLELKIANKSTGTH